MKWVEVSKETHVERDLPLSLRVVENGVHLRKKAHLLVPISEVRVR